ncbi:MAG TPA: long-chain fatty acid--CoA ligase [Ignavibacteriaceae bacterium]|nr:long-chain fatty acid--CoA ligase [Ignavibacteriaceae bacterium]
MSSEYPSTIPELFQHLTSEENKKINQEFMFYKFSDYYEGITYARFKKETENFALGLVALGVEAGDKIALISENRPEWVYADMGILSIGAINVPLFPSFTPETIAFVLENSESKGVIVSNKLMLNKILKMKSNLARLKFIIVINEKDISEDSEKIISFNQVQEKGKSYINDHPNYLSDQMNKIDKNDVCTIIYTSGTTGEPKGVVLTHWNIMSNVHAALQVFPITENDVWLSYLPLCHTYERMAGYYAAFTAGSQVYYAETIETVPKNLLEARPTIMTSVPRLFERFYSKVIKNVESQSSAKQKIFYKAVEVGKEYAKAKKLGKNPITLAIQNQLFDKLVFKKIRERTGGRLRFFVSGGAALSHGLGEFFEILGITILEGYGLTESSPVIAANRMDDYKFGTVGKPLPGVEVKIAPDGEILAKGPNVMVGYYKNRKETEAVLKEGWLHTGDIGRFDSDGFLMITDRKKHLFKTSAGKYVAPTPIETLFQSSKYIDQFVLIGDRRTYLSALIVPDFESLREYADTHNIPYNKVEDLTKKQEIYELIEKEMTVIQKKLANYEKVRKFTLLDHSFSLENGEITPSLKIRRQYVEERYKPLIEAMYSEN